jgi:hypothetical protein
MKLSKTVKYLVGALTLLYMLLPLVFIPIWFLSVFGIAVSSERGGGPPPIIFFTWLGMMFFIILINVVHIGLVSFYVVHNIKNREGNDTARILLGVGTFFLPWLAMPFYYFIYVWPDNPPEWALEKPGYLPSVVPPEPMVPAETAISQTPEIVGAEIAQVEVVVPVETQTAPELAEPPVPPGPIRWEKAGEAEDAAATAVNLAPVTPSAAVEPSPTEEPAAEAAKAPVKKPTRKRVNRVVAEKPTQADSERTMISPPITIEDKNDEA